MMLLALMGMALAGAGELPEWTFDADAEGWVPNGHLANVFVRNGKMRAEAVDWDPFLTCSGLAIEAKPWQYVLIHIRSDRTGTGELFWTGETSGEHGGFSQEKRAPFQVKGKGVSQEVVVFPFWHAEGTIRQLRLDLYSDACFEIDAIRIREWGADLPPLMNIYSWRFDGDVSAWQVHPTARELFAPPLDLPVKNRGWAAVTLQSDRDGLASVLWGTPDGRGLRSADFAVEGGPASHTYNVELQGLPDWGGQVAAFGIRLPHQQQVRLESVDLATEPQGPPDLAVEFFGFEEAINRTGKPAAVVAHLVNRGGQGDRGGAARLVLSPDLRFARPSKSQQDIPALAFGQRATLKWRVSAYIPGTFTVYLRAGEGAVKKADLRFTKALLLPKADYPAEPEPLRTDYDVCAYYFPGWESDVKWDCIRRVAPIRKPALGYYDESRPECVDWQIKWALENAINCFLVDWYWCEGQQHLTHWFEAYRKARYRDLLRVAIMWANHNPPGTHSAEDLRAVTRHWIDHYFNLPSYFQIDGKPAVFIWAPHNIRKDLGGSDAVKASLEEAQTMAREAGYEGITFVAMGYDFSRDNVEALAHEGYSAITTYHEWGIAGDAASHKRIPFEGVVEQAPEAWAHKNKAAGPLTYYPVIDTGWDARPWHGDGALVIEGRTPALFERLLDAAKDFARANDKKILVLGPLNEWGEGSYIEPNLEFGFTMYEAVRNILGRGNPRKWPVNMAPCDIGLGPYGFPSRDPVSSWAFDGPHSGWQAMMGVGDVTCEDGRLRLRTTTADPALMAQTYGIRAANFPKAEITMQLTGPVSEGDMAQIFWSTGGAAVTEATSVRFPLATDGAMHTYTVDLAANPRWRNLISTLRFDPCCTKDVEVVLDRFHLTK